MERLRVRLAKLDGSQEEVVSVSNQALQLPSDMTSSFVKEWSRACQESIGNCLPYIYVANDIIQKSKRENSDLDVKFQKVLPSILEQINDSIAQDKISRVLGIWLDRKVYDAEFIKLLRHKLSKKKILNPLFEEDDNENPTSEHEAYEDGDDDYDEEESQQIIHPQNLSRQDSMLSIKQEIPLPRLITLCKKATNKSHQLMETSHDLASKALEQFPEGGKELEDHIATLSDEYVDELYGTLRQLLKQSKSATSSLESSQSLEASLISALERHLDSLKSKNIMYEEYKSKCINLRMRLEALMQSHSGHEVLSMTIQVPRLQKIEVQQTGKRVRGESESESSDYEEEEDDDDDNDDDELSEAAKDNDIAGRPKTISSRQSSSILESLDKKLKRRRKKKKTQEKEATEATVTMVYNRLTKEYVPLEDLQSESWRDH